MKRMKRFLLAAASAVLALGVIVPTASVGAASDCQVTWGSLPKSLEVSVISPLVDVRTGQHDCYDRMVFDLNGVASGYRVQYVDSVFTQGSGQLIPLAGGAKLQITVLAPAYDTNGNPTYPAVVGQPLPNVDLTGYRTFRDAKYAGSFEGQTTIGLGVRARLPFRVFTLDNRVVVDVAHHW